MQSNPWKTIKTREIYKNPWLSLREDQVIKPNGDPGIYSVIETRIATGVVALTPDNQIYLVGQFRYPTNVYSWEIPEGGTDHNESPMDAAKRELREEAGVIAREWEQLGGEIHLSNCLSSERGFLYLAKDLEETEPHYDDTEVITVKKIPFAHAMRMVDSGEITDGMTIIALLRASRVLGL